MLVTGVKGIHVSSTHAHQRVLSLPVFPERDCSSGVLGGALLGSCMGRGLRFAHVHLDGRRTYVVDRRCAPLLPLHRGRTSNQQSTGVFGTNPWGGVRPSAAVVQTSPISLFSVGVCVRKGGGISPIGPILLLLDSSFDGWFGVFWCRLCGSALGLIET